MTDMKRASQLESERRKVHHRDDQEEDESSSSSSEEEDDIEWIGDSFENEHASQSYQSAKIDGIVYNIGDSVYVEVDGWGIHQPALLTHLWEDEYGEKLARGNWYYFAVELKLKKVERKIYEDELFASEHGDDFPLLAIRGKLKVTDDPKVAKSGKLKLCRSTYNPTTKTLLPRDDRDKAPPAMIEEDEEVEHKDSFSLALSALELSAVPEVMPCREKEKDAITSFILSGVKNGGCTSALYVSGLPGTGKTATVHEVVKSIRHMQKQKQVPAFRYIEINGLKLTVPDEAYTVLAKEIIPEFGAMSTAKASQALDAYFSRSDSKRQVTVLLVDEIDHLMTKKQQLLYSLFDWPQRNYSKLVVVGVSNTINFPEMLLPRIQSRLGKERVLFHPYSRDQIDTIIRQRLSEANVFDSNAIEFAARKVASVSGDVRRALQLCRRAVTICSRNQCPFVSMEHIIMAVKEIDARLHCHAVTTLSSIQKLFLACIYKHCIATNAEQVLFRDVHMRLMNLCRTVTPLVALAGRSELQMFIKMAEKLIHLGLIKSDPENLEGEERPVLSLCLDFEDVRGILSSDEIIGPLI